MDAASLLLSWAIMAQMPAAPTGVPPRLGSSPAQVPSRPATSGAKPPLGDSKPASGSSPFGQRGGTGPTGDSSSRPPFGSFNSATPNSGAGGSSFPMNTPAGQPTNNSFDFPSGPTPGASRSGVSGVPSSGAGKFVPPLRIKDDALPPAPETRRGAPEPSPTPAPPPPRRDLAPEPPISGPLAPVRHEEPGTLAKSVLAEALNPPPGESLTGQSVALFDALARSAGRVARAETAKAYWAASTATADYYIWLDAEQRLKQLADGARSGGGAGAELAAALASVQAQLQEAELVATETRHRLASYLGDPQLEPMCADAPHVGGYRTEFERLFTGRQPPPNLHLIHRTLPLRQRAIELRAEAVRSAREALDAMTTAYTRGQAEGRDVLLHLDLYRAARQSFVHEVESYNGQIADYAVGIAGEGGDLHSFVPLLIRTSTGSSILTPNPQPALGAPTAVPPGSALPPAPNSADAGERSILRSRTRLADVTRDDAVHPALAEGPPVIEKTFVGAAPSPAEPLQKVDPWEEPQLKPVDAKSPGDKAAATPAAGAKPAGGSPSPAPAKAPNAKGAKPEPASTTAPTGGAAPAKDSTPAKDKPAAKEPAAAKEPTPAKDASSAGGGQGVKQVVFRPETPDTATSLIDVARIRPEQWAAALAERLHETPANPLENHVVPTPLRDCLRQTPTPAERRVVIGAFWTARECAARYQAAVMRGRQIDLLRDAIEPPARAGSAGQASSPAGRSLGSLMYSALRAAAEADEENARVELSSACYQLTVAARQPAAGAWLWPGTRPPAQRLALPPAPSAAQPASAAAAQAAVSQRHLEAIIRGSYALLGDRAAAVIKADAARMDCAARAAGRGEPAAPYLWIERQHDETLRFLGALTRYHLAYADYTLANTPANAPPEALAQRLLASEPVQR